jgi:hypothetical protein
MNFESAAGSGSCGRHSSTLPAAPVCDSDREYRRRPSAH